MSTASDSPRDAARLLGAHYSPRPVVDFVVGRTLGDLLRQRRWSAPGALPRICDPACGAGVFLLSALDRLCRRWLSREVGPDPAPGWLAERLPRCLFGVDVDPLAVSAARDALRQSAVRWDPACAGLDLADNIVVGNSLVSPADGPAAWRPVCYRERFPAGGEPGGGEPGGGEPGRFDLVVSNPPFVDSEEMTRSAPALRRYLAERYETAVGNWDLFCPFVERASELLSADGRLGLILPNKLLSAAYARETRRLLAAMDLVLLRDYSRVRLFDAAVYPIVLVARRRPRRRPTLRVEVAAGSLDACRIETRHTTDSAAAARAAEAGWSTLFAPPVVTATGPRLRTLGEVARVTGAASVADAYTLQPLVRECDHDHDRGCHRLINTGTIDPYQALWGRRRLRYLGATYERPCVDAGALEAALPSRAAQARASKIVVAGLARRLECVLDHGGLVAGKSTSLVLAPASDVPVDLALLLGLLNSAAASTMLRQQFGGLTLSGGYLRIGPPQLRALQIPDPAAIPAPLRQQIREASLALCRLGAEGAKGAKGAEGAKGAKGAEAGDEHWRAQRARIDEPSWSLFGLEPVSEA